MGVRLWRYTNINVITIIIIINVIMSYYKPSVAVDEPVLCLLSV